MHKRHTFRPSFVDKNPKGSGPIIAPMLIKEPIHDSSSGVIGCSNGLISGLVEYNLGSMGDVQVNVVSPAVAKRFAKILEK